MQTKMKVFLFSVICLGILLSFSWRSLAASPPSLRDQPELWEHLSGVVVFDPTLAGKPYGRADQIPRNLNAIWNLLSVPTGINVLTNQDPTLEHQNEPSIAVNPQNPLHIIASSNDYRLRVSGGDVHPGYYVSFDGGLTWPGDGVIDLSSIPDALAGGDPAMAIYDESNVYFAYIAFNRTIDDRGGVFVSKSTDGGLTWNNPVPVAWNTLTVFHDKEYIGVDATGSPYDGNVYVSWTRFEFTYPIYFARSIDGGASFQAPYQISDNNLSSNQGSVPVVGPDGKVYVAWYNYNTGAQRMAISQNGGQSFGSPFQVASVTAIPSPLPGSNFRNNSFPTLAVDPNNGNLYVAWNDYRFGDADILMIRSTNGGSTWSSPIRVNDDAQGNDFHQFFPWITVAPNGNVYVGWFDSRNDPNPYLQPFIYDAYVAVSSDGGQTFSPNVRISEVSSDASIGFSGQFIGDYSGIAATNDFVYPAWVDTRRGHQDIYTQAPVALGNKSAPELVERGQPFVYSITLNSPQGVAGNNLVDPFPVEVNYVPGSLWASAGTYGEAGGVITWEGDLAAGVPLSITFQAVPVAFCSTSFTNTALLTGGFPGELSFSASSLISGTLPLVNFLPSNFTPEVGEVVTFTNLTTGDEPLSYLWSFGDGFTSTEISPSHVFTSVGAYQITLTATNACGFTEHTELLNVTCDSPQPYFNWVNDELVINFTNLTTGTLPIDYLWEFGDGLTSTQVAPTHSYAIPAEYTVTLNATNTCGTESYTAVVNAACTAPQTGFTWSSDDLSFLFTNTSTGRFPLDFLWTFGDSFSSTLESPPHTYTLPGQYTVTLNTTDLCGTGIYSEQVSASCPDPTAAFIWSVNGLSVNFTNLSTGTLPLDFLWDFGDGITSTEISPIHIYDTIGTYTVKLTAKEACGSSIFTAQIIIVGYPVYVPVIFNR